MVNSIFTTTSLLHVYLFVSGAHIPSLSSEEEFLDLVYLGIFVMLSPAFDRRFYSKPPATLLNEAAYAIRSFHGLMLLFSLRFTIFLEGTAVAVSYVVDRILVEFAAAAVVFARGVEAPNFGQGNDGSSIRITFPRFLKTVKGILEEHDPHLLPFFSARTDANHKNFLWTGPELQIVPRSEDVIAIMNQTGDGELVDFPANPIYSQELADSSSAPATSFGKRDRSVERMDVVDEQPRKRRH